MRFCHEGLEVNISARSTSALAVVEWSTLRRGCFTLVKGTILKDAGCIAELF
jgi:hypothetical protein